MELLLDFDEIDPPTGRLCAVTRPGRSPDRAESVPFCGWLGLLRALSEAVLDPACDRPDDR